MSDQAYRTEPPYGQQRYGSTQHMGGPQSGELNNVMASVIDAARRHPIGAALVGLGIVGLFPTRRLAAAPTIASRILSAGSSVMADMARSRGGAVDNASGYVSNIGESARQAANVVASAASRAGEAVGSSVDQAGNVANSFGEAMRTTSSTASTALSQVASSTRSQFGQILHDQPLLLAAGAFAVGAAIGASLPRTETEDRLLGDASENLMESSGDSIGARVQNATRAAKEEARRQGLTSDALKAEAAKLRDKATGAVSRPG
jgi:hypothetical protein